MNTEPGTLRQLITEGLAAIETQLKEIREVIKTMGERPVRHYEFENLKLQVASLAEGLTELEIRVVQLERYKSVTQWIFRQAVTILVIVVIIYLLGVWR